MAAIKTDTVVQKVEDMKSLVMTDQGRTDGQCAGENEVKGLRCVEFEHPH